MAETGRVNILYLSLPHKTWKNEVHHGLFNSTFKHCTATEVLFLEFSFHHPSSSQLSRSVFQHSNTHATRTKHESWFFLEVPTLSISGQATSRYGANVLRQETLKKKPTGFSQKPLKNSCLWWRNLGSNLVTHGCRLNSPVNSSWDMHHPPPTWYSEETHPRGW